VIELMFAGEWLLHLFHSFTLLLHGVLHPCTFRLLLQCLERYDPLLQPLQKVSGPDPRLSKTLPSEIDGLSGPHKFGNLQLAIRRPGSTL
jgi:hypothetical protein